MVVFVVDIMTSHPTTALIDLDALSFNVDQLRAMVGTGKKLLAVVKANAYGHGAIPVARELELLPIDYLGVAFWEEGMQLRKAGIKKPIVILGGIFPEHAGMVFSHNLTPVVYDRGVLLALEAEGKARQQSIAVHIKIDTGMNRLGICIDQIPTFLEQWKKLPHVAIEGILSHFSSAHLKDEESEAFTEKQAGEFRKAVGMVEELRGTLPLTHMSSSSSIIHGLMRELSMARVGLLLYGVHPAKGLGPAIPLKPVMTLRTKILQIKSLPGSSPVSYGRTFRTRRPSMIATIGVGYGDGFCHTLSNRGRVLIRGKTAPVVGAVCMDLTMVDITDISGSSVGEEVVLFGRQGKQQLTVEEIATQAGTIAYAVLCGVSTRVPRIYVKNGKVISEQ